MSFTFNIIYTPGTVPYLTFFVYSLLHWSNCSFRLVANGCSLAEEHALRAFCGQNPRLEFYRLPTDRVIEHGVALNQLQRLTQSDKFCFMDSDIYASAEFMNQFLLACPQHAGIFSCSPVWCKAEEQELASRNPIMAGEFNRTEQGLCLGNTYFALYDQQLLTEFRQRMGIGFERLRWAEIATIQQKQLRALKVQKEFYDTGKLLNIFLQQQGYSLCVLESSTVHHLGGVSIVPIQRENSEAAMAKTTKRIFFENLWEHTKLRLRRLWQPDYYCFGFSQRRATYKIYFHDLLVALAENDALPVMPKTGEPEMEERIMLATQQIQELYQKVHRENFILGSSVLP